MEGNFGVAYNTRVCNVHYTREFTVMQCRHLTIRALLMSSFDCFTLFTVNIYLHCKSLFFFFRFGMQAMAIVLPRSLDTKRRCWMCVLIYGVNSSRQPLLMVRHYCVVLHCIVLVNINEMHLQSWSQKKNI